MSDELTNLVLGVDSTPVVKATTDLDKLTAAGDKAEVSATKLGKSSADLSSKINPLSQATATTAQKALDLAAATDKLTVGQAQLLEKLQRMADTANLSKKALLEYEAAEMGVAQGAQAYIDKITAVVDAEKGHGISMSSNIAKIEALRIVHDAAIGSYGRMGSAMLVMGNATGLSAMAFSAAGLSVLGLIAPLGFLAAAFYAGSEESKKFNASLIETGNYAGLTKSSFQSMSTGVADAANGGVGVAKEALQALASTGRVTGDAMGAFGKVMIEQSRITGQSLDDIAKDYAKMPDGVAKWAEQHNQSMHFMGLAQYEHIRLLEEQGKTQQAMIEVSKALDSQFGSHVEHLGYLESALRKTGIAWSEFWNWSKSIGRDKTAQEGVDDLTRKILEQRAVLSRLNPNDSSVTANQVRSNLEKLQDEQSIQQSDVLEQKKFAAFTTERARINELANAAKDYNDKQLSHYDKAIALSKALKAQQLQFDNQKAGGDPVSAADQKKILDGIRNDYADKAPKEKVQSTSGYDKLIADIEKYNALTDIESATDAKVSANDKWRVDALAMLDTAYGKGATSLSNYLRLWDAVQEAYGKRGDADQAAQDKINESKATEQAVKERQKYLDQMDKESVRIEDQAKKRQDQNAALGKTKDVPLYLEAAQQQEKATALQLQAIKQVDRDLDMQRYDATMKAAQAYQDLADATKAAADEQYKLTHGGAYAYFESIQDKGVATASIVSKAFKGMEDSLVTFATTGKLDFSSMANSIIADLIRIQIQQSITKPLAAAMSGGLSSIFGFATGGNPTPGVPYLVGENGPEIRVDTGPGVITPNHMTGGGGAAMTINQPIVINAQNASAETIGQIRAMMPGLLATNARTITAVVQQAFAKQGMKVSI